MRLVHLTERPLEEVCDFYLTQGLGARAFNTSQSDIMAEVKQTFKRFEKARIQLDAPIVPNLVLIDNSRNLGHNDAIVSKGTNGVNFYREARQCNYTIQLATQSNHIFEINFERHYFQMGATIYVSKSDSEILGHL